MTVYILIINSIEELNELKCKLISQANVIKEYEGWVNILINIINSKNDKVNHNDFSTPVQKVRAHLIIGIRKNREYGV